MNFYYKNILGQILQNEQPELKEMIDLRFESGYKIEEKMVYNLEDLTITEAVLFLEENWEYLQPFLR